MKRFITLLILLVGFAFYLSSSSPHFDAAAQDAKKPQDTYTLAQEAKLGPVTFSHVNHITKNRNAEGNAIACVECHHTAQPASEAVKHPPHKTVWPADRTTTLTAEELAKDPNAVGAVCRDCHARAETKPKLLPEIPKIKAADGTELVMTNQQAFHRNCGGCHDQVAKAKADSTAPTSKKCMSCHKKTAA